MVQTRKPLGSLVSAVNVGGEEVLRTRVGAELTAVERQTARMVERREQTWRHLTRERVVAFFELFLRSMVWTENGDREGRPHPATCEAFLGVLANRIIPWVDQHRVWSNCEKRWPMSLEHFREMDNELNLYLPSVYASRPWQRIRVYFGDMARVREWRLQEERERRLRCSRLDQVRRVLDL